MIQTMKHYLLLLFLPAALMCNEKAISVREQYLIEHVKQSIDKADHGISSLSSAVLNVSGMTSYKVKRLLNNICTLPDSYYLEIGVWKGATFTAALFNNQENIKEAIAIDSWEAVFGGLNEFRDNCNNFISNVNYRYHQQDSFAVDIHKIFNHPIDIYFYDGEHTAEAQEQAFTYYDSIFASTFIAIIDDWNYGPAKLGTKIAFEKLNYTILFEQELPARFNGDTELWWHGIYVAVIRRNVN